MEVKEIKYVDIEKANKTIKTTDIKGKEYAEVNQRIKAFRMIYPQGTIKTVLVSNNDGVCIFRAEVYEYEKCNEAGNYESKLLGTGMAYEKENSTFINKTSYIENCETSAVGRALGMCGFGIDTSVASAEEVKNAMANQKKEEKTTVSKDAKITPTQINEISKIYAGENLEKLLKANGLEKLQEMSMTKASEIIKKVNEKRKEKENGTN
jgi:hypothetical protein